VSRSAQHVAHVAHSTQYTSLTHRDILELCCLLQVLHLVSTGHVAARESNGRARFVFMCFMRFMCFMCFMCCGTRGSHGLYGLYGWNGLYGLCGCRWQGFALVAVFGKQPAANRVPCELAVHDGELRECVGCVGLVPFEQPPEMRDGITMVAPPPLAHTTQTSHTSQTSQTSHTEVTRTGIVVP
jgi:hypothetical protein